MEEKFNKKKFTKNQINANSTETTNQLQHPLDQRPENFQPIEEEFPPTINETETEARWAAIPYAGNLSNKIAGVLRRKLKWKVTFTPGVKVLHMLNSIKDEEEHPPTSIYEIPCAICPSTYVGETERPFEVRKEDHEGYLRRREYKQSAIVKHLTKTRNHSINWNNAKIIAHERN